MTTTAVWAGTGIGTCRLCDMPSYLYTHSLVGEISKLNLDNGNWRYQLDELCMDCFQYQIMGVMNEVRTYNNDGDMVETELYRNLRYLRSCSLDMSWQTKEDHCDLCARPFSDDENSSWFKIEASSGKDRTIIVQVHKRCSIYVDCCSTRYANGWHTNHGVEIHRFEGEEICRLCMDNKIEERGHDIREYFTCQYCEYYHHRDERQSWNGQGYCENCYDSYLYSCDECGDQYWDGNDHYCESDSDSDGVIHDYYYKPRPYFFGKRVDERLYFGVELEVENRSNESTQDLAEMVQEALGERVYIKHDGSLDDGFEIVTHPHSLQAFHKEFGWESFQRFRKEGLRSWDTGTCGLHVHVSRNAFGVPYDNRTTRAEYIKSRQTHEIKFIKLIYDNERQICRIAGRKNPEYANFHDKGKIVSKVKWNDTVGGRHAAVNTNNDNTLEVRVFKGSLQPARVLAAVELVHAAVEYTRDLKVTGPKTMYITEQGKAKSTALSWLAFSGYVSSNADMYPNLTRLMVKTLESEQLAE